MVLKLGKKAAKSETTVHGGVSTFARATTGYFMRDVKTVFNHVCGHTTRYLKPKHDLSLTHQVVFCA